MKMKPNGGQTHFHAEKDVITADKNGIFDIPDHLAEIAKSHGFEEVKEEPKGKK